jgi:hypothetical protein
MIYIPCTRDQVLRLMTQSVRVDGAKLSQNPSTPALITIILRVYEMMGGYRVKRQMLELSPIGSPS